MIKVKTKTDPVWNDHLANLCQQVAGLEVPRHWADEWHYRVTPSEVDQITQISLELYEMCLNAADRIFSEERLHDLGLPTPLHELLYYSWHSRTRAPFCFRVDLALASRLPSFVDCGTTDYQGFFSASIIQWHWLQSIYPQFGQFNSIWPVLVDAFDALNREVPGTAFTLLHSCNAHHRYSVSAIREAAHEANCRLEEEGIETLIGEASTHIKSGDSFIYNLCNLHEIEAAGLDRMFENREGSARWIGGLWTLIFDMPGFNRVLHEIFPRHPLLGSPKSRGAKSWPLQVRETRNASKLLEAAHPVTHSTKTSGWTRITSWVINGEVAGMGIKDYIETERKFIPHLVV